MAAKLNESESPLAAETVGLDPDDSHAVIAQYLEKVLFAGLATHRGKEAAKRQQALAGRLIETLRSELGSEWEGRFDLADPLVRLLAVHVKGETAIAYPDTPPARSALITGTRREPSLALQLAKEFEAADRVDILCSFIKWSGLRLLLDSLKVLTQTPHPDGGPRLRVITTSYMGATDPKAVEALRLLPNTEVKVSYDTKRTRLHAKAYLVQRSTGFGSAYVGSANVSGAALSEGLEWTNKISQYELPYLWQKVVATFEGYWNDDEFEVYGEGSKDRLARAIKREQSGGDDDVAVGAGFDIHPYPFQEEILDALAAGRDRGLKRQLVVAATGTGKTVVAALDYRDWAKAWPGAKRPPLLFVAHREEILRQAMATFRGVLRDQNFGDLLVGGIEPEQTDHLFCSIQSYQSRGLVELAADCFSYVVVDEFHHASAASYRGLLDHVEPEMLLALTATPERMDGFNVASYFDGGAAASIRLPDAIERRLLCPFQYFGISDGVDLSGLTWQRGGYRFEDLDRLYTGNDARAMLVLEKLEELVLAPKRARGLGFCVSVAHAEFMARYFSEKGVPAVALSAETEKELRRGAIRRLVSREINFIFTVDLFNEGVDIPEADTVLLLRPTESLTVYLQQLGRGLRLHEDKECLTVLDFIGAQNERFSFASRFRAMSSRPEANLADEVERGFPHLPAWCTVRLERVAKQHVLGNISRAWDRSSASIAAGLRELGGVLGRVPSLEEGLEFLQTDLASLLRFGLLSRHLERAGLIDEVVAPDEKRLAKGLQRLTHLDDPELIEFAAKYARGERPAAADRVAEGREAMLLGSLWGAGVEGAGAAEAGARLDENPSALEDLSRVLEYRRQHVVRRDPGTAGVGPLALHARYTRDEILLGLGYWELGKPGHFAQGVLHRPELKADVFFVTLNKTEDDYSPTTMYEDYVISRELFHWQSQSTTSEQSVTGQRYINHRSMGYTPLLFVRLKKKQPDGLAMPYHFLGGADYVTHTGSRPMSITWKLRAPMPARFVHAAMA